ncbi:MAG: aspartate aminotransferase family protein [Clostridia bacterium]|nr:aspartate aminotransferase family protein [Clostridia bacterium]
MNINPVIKINQRMYEGNESAFITTGENIYLYDSNGKKYIDFCGGIWNVPFGYSNPTINNRITEQLKRLPFCNLISNTADIQHHYAVRLCKLLGSSALLYTCSGSECIEAAIKTCRLYQTIKGSNRRDISAFNLSYHGTSYGAMSVSGVDNQAFNYYYPMVGGIKWISAPRDIENTELWLKAIEEHFRQNADAMAGIIIEPVFGSGGIIPLPYAALKRLEELCRENDILLVADEVSTGFGRTGVPFVFKSYGIDPDLTCLSKGITNGYLPLGVLAFSSRVTGVFAEKHAVLEHFSSQGGNLLAIAAADAVLDLMENYEEFEVSSKGEYFKNILKELLSPYKNVSVRGCGLMLAISFNKEPQTMRFIDILAKIRKRGLLTYHFYNPGYNAGLSFFPPYTSSRMDLQDAAEKVVSILKHCPDIIC